MAGTNSIKVMLLHQHQILFNLPDIDYKSCLRIRIMAVDATEFNLFSIEINNLVPNFNRPKANPIATGRITVSTIETNIGSALIEICAPLARYDTRSGVINGERIVDTVVIPTEKATSPPQRYDMIFEETPPGQHPTSISPSPIPSESPRTFVIPKPGKAL